MGCRGSRDKDLVLDPDRTAIARNRFPDAVGRRPQASQRVRRGLRLVNGGDSVERMAEIARCGQIRWPAIFIATVAGDWFRQAECGCQARFVFRIERDVEDLAIVVAMLALGNPRPDDRGGYRLVTKHPGR